jgi:hypothetical protein
VCDRAGCRWGGSFGTSLGTSAFAEGSRSRCGGAHPPHRLPR